MDAIQITILLVVPLVAYTLKGAVGFGPALLVVPTFALAFSPQLALSYSAAIDILVGIYMVATLQPLREDYRSAKQLLKFMVFGSLFGVFMLAWINASYVSFIIAMFALIFGVYLFIFPPGRGFRIRIPIAPAAVLGGFSGMVGGMSGPPIVSAISGRHGKAAFRNVLVIVFLAEQIIKVIAYALIGVFDFKAIQYLAATIPSVVLGTFFGYLLHNKVAEITFFRLIALILVAIGSSAISGVFL